MSGERRKSTERRMSKEDLEAGVKAQVLINAEMDDKIEKAADSKSLDLHAYKLTEIQPTVFQITQLQRLQLHNNELTTLPSEIGNLVNLNVLYLQDNHLIDIPPQIGNLRVMWTLALHNNELRYLPREIGYCARLQVLTVNKNHLTDLPLELGDCRELRSIDVKENAELTVPPLYVVNQGPAKVAEYLLRFGSSKMGSKVLDLSKFKLKGFPAEITQCAHIRDLQLSGNVNIAHLPYEICHLRRLQVVKIESSKLTGRITQGFGCLTNLIDISLASNDIVSIPLGLGNATGLTKLNLDKNFSMMLPPKDIQTRGFPSNFEFIQKLSHAERSRHMDLHGLKLTKLDFFHAAVCSAELTFLPEPLDLGNPWTHLVILDLSANRLSALDRVLGEMSNLKTMLCTSNRLDCMPNEFTNLKELNLLRLDDNAFSQFPNVICFGDEGIQVEEKQDLGFDTSALGLSQVQVKTVWGPGEPHPALVQLDFSNNQLTNIFKAIVYVSTIKVLQLSSNKLTKLPPDFGKLIGLESLNLSHNLFVAFPNDIWKCTALRVLVFSNNKLKSIPSVIESLALLEELDISHNNITELPVEIGCLANMKRPKFKGNQLDGIPGNLLQGGDDAIFAFWRAMVQSMRSKVFDVSNTGMVDVPLQMGNMTWLTELNLSHNSLLKMAPQIGQLSQVRYLNLSHNRLNALATEIRHMKELRVMNITGNNIRQLPLELGFCMELREIHMDDSMIVMPSRLILDLGVRAMIIYMRRLYEANESGKLGITGMGLQNIPKEVLNMIDLQEMLLDKNEIHDIEQEIVFFDNLVSLSANLNQIENLDFLLGDPKKAPWNKQRLSSLTSLKLRGNQLQVLPQEITRLKELRFLMLENNLFEELPDEVGRLVRLEEFSVARNQLQQLPNTLSSLVELRTLDISRNKIWFLPFALGKLSDLVKFLFNDNPIREPPVEVTKRGQDYILEYMAALNEALQNTNSFEQENASLYEIPREVCRITNLTKLNLADNKIAYVRKEIMFLSKLEYLNLSENNLRKFPLMICDLTLLGDLNLSENAFNRLPLELGRLTLLRRLGLDGLDLIQPAREVAYLGATGVVKYMRKFWRILNGNTKKLDVSNVGFASFPKEVTMLGDSIEVLKIDGNKILDLTEEIGNNSALHTLSASSNELMGLPYEINYLTALKSLDVSKNSISALPNVPNLKNLETLDVSRNQLHSLPNNLKRWTKLRHLDANNNNILALPEGIGQLHTLISLDVSSNRIKMLPSSFGKLSRLASLNAKDNNMTFLPNEIAQVTSFTELAVAGNRILALPPALCLCTSITRLDISLSHLLVPPAETHAGGIHTMFSYLQSLYLAQFDDSLKLHKWNLQAFPMDGNFLTQITHLNLSENQLRQIPSTLGMYQRIRILQLDHNILETLPDAVGQLHGSLSDLSISSNHLIRLPSGLWKLTSLTRLNMSKNTLKVIPDQFSRLTMLRYLDMDFNKISQIPEAIGTMSRLQELLLEDNPIRFVSPAAFVMCRSLRLLKVEVEWLDDLAAWRKDLTLYAQIQSHGVRFPPTEVLMQGADAIWKYMVVVSHARKSKILDLSRVSFWMLEMEDAKQRFYSWPIDVSNYDYLESLNLSGNFLVTIPDTVSNLTNLAELDLEQNRLKTLPTALAFCTALERLMVLRNPDLSSPSREVTSKGSSATIKFLSCLHTAQTEDLIRFEHSSYRRMPREFLTTTNVTMLSLTNNAIEILPGDILVLDSLLELWLDNNQLALLPDELCEIQSLELLSLEKNLLVALPDDITNLVNLKDIRAAKNFMGDPPPEVAKVGADVIIEYLMEFKKGRTSGIVDLSGFDLTVFPLEAVYIDKPQRWSRFAIDRYVRAFSEELNKQRKRELEVMKDLERKNMREAMGLDPDLISQFSETDATWNALDEFCEDACIELGPFQTRRVRHKLRTLDDFYDSFSEWYAFALGYNNQQEMEANKDNDEDVRKKPDDITLFDALVKRFGPAEVEGPCRWCCELGNGCVELDSMTGKNRRHKGLHKSARAGWYNVKLRMEHGNDAKWSEDENEDALSDVTEKEQDLPQKSGGGNNQGPGSEDFDDNFSDADSGFSADYDDGGGFKTGFDDESSSDEELDDPNTLTNILSGGSFPFIQTLNLHDNLIMHIPPEIKVMKHLEYLRLSHNVLSLLPAEMGKLKSLTHLNLGGNRVSYLPDHMSALVNLKILDIRRNEFKHIPDSCQYYTNLRKLVINDNHLLNISSVLGNCELLEELWVQDNKLTSIHPLVGDLDRLNTLNLGNNEITSISPQIGNCVALTRLGIYGNGLARLPPSLKKLKYLKTLMVNHNVLLDIPETTMFMHELQELVFNDNEVTALQPSLCKVETLLSLKLQNNSISLLPPEIKGLSHLRELRLDNNNIKEICPEIQFLTGLVLLMLNNNELTTLPPEIGALSNITKLSLDSNKLELLPQEIGRMESLHRVWLDDNKLVELPDGISDCEHLIELHLDHNSLYELCPSFSKLTNLLELFCHNNSFGHVKQGPNGENLGGPFGVPEGICHLPSLKALSISGNDLDTEMLPPTMSKLTNLTELWIQENNFDELPRVVCDLPSLRYFFMDQDVDALHPTSDFFGQAAFPPESDDATILATRRAKDKLANKKGMLDRMMASKGR